MGCGMGWMVWMGWMDGVSKVSFSFLSTLWVHILCIFLLICVVKSCHQHYYGFQNSMSSWGVGVWFSKLLWGNVFLRNRAKSKVFQKHQRQQAFFELIFQNCMSSWGVKVWFTRAATGLLEPARWIQTSLARSVAYLARTVASLERTVASFARTVPKPLHSTFGVQHNLHTRRVAPSLRMGWNWMG